MIIIGMSGEYFNKCSIDTDAFVIFKLSDTYHAWPSYNIPTTGSKRCKDIFTAIKYSAGYT